MDILYTIEEFNKAKTKDKLPIKCKNCQKVFLTTKYYIQAGIRRKMPVSFCSRGCKSTSSIKRQLTKCANCGKEILRKKHEILKYKNIFCSCSCSTSYNNTHKTKGSRVSKLEVWLQKKLKIYYPETEIHFNRKDAINSELDIYFPQCKLAFEVNGIFHYKPIFGKEKLKAIQENDKKKIDACTTKGIELFIINTSGLTYYKEDRLLIFLEAIIQIMDKKLSWKRPRTSDLE